MFTYAGAAGKITLNNSQFNYDYFIFLLADSVLIPIFVFVVFCCFVLSKRHVITCTVGMQCSITFSWIVLLLLQPCNKPFVCYYYYLYEISILFFSCLFTVFETETLEWNTTIAATKWVVVVEYSIKNNKCKCSYCVKQMSLQMLIEMELVTAEQII